MFILLSNKSLSNKALWPEKSQNQRASRACSCYTGMKELRGTEEIKTKDMFDNNHYFLNGGSPLSGHSRVNFPCYGGKARWKCTEIMTLFVILLLYSDISLANNYCGRKIISGKQGVVSDGPGLYPNRRSCEWLIKGTSLKVFFAFIKALVISMNAIITSRYFSVTGAISVSIHILFQYRSL